MSDLHPVFVRAKEILLTKGWHCGGARGSNGELCIIISCCDAYQEIYGNRILGDEISRIHLILQEIISTSDVAMWNDSHDRTLEEVIAALDQAIILTAPVVEYASVC